MSQTKVTDNLRDTTQLDATKITTGTIPEARITSLDATKLTGNIANARIPASAVTQHVTGFDDSSIRADILKLALHQAIDGNRAAYNLEDSFVDGFEDDTGITTETNCDRDTAGEYVGTIATEPNTKLYMSFDSSGTAMEGLDSDSYTATLGSPAVRYTTDKKFGSGSLAISNNASYLELTPGTGDIFDDNISGDWTIEWWHHNNGGDGYYRTILNKADHSGNNREISLYYNSSNTLYLDVVLTGGTTNINFGTGWASGVLNADWVHWAIVRDGDTLRLYIGGVEKGSASCSGNMTNTYDAFRFGSSYVGSNYGSSEGWYDDIRFSNVCRYTSGTTFTPHTSAHSPNTVNATGTLISDPQTASTSRTSCSGVIIYEDAVGTNTLGTDLKIYFTANNGTNWTEAASYGTATTYSGTKKLVKLGATTVTAGTQVAMKAVWANQAASVAGGYQSGDRSSTITVTTTGPVANGNIANLVDGDAPTDGSYGASDSFYYSNGSSNTSGLEVKFQLSSAQTFTGARMLGAGASGAGASQGTWKWQGSNDGASWTDIGANFDFTFASQNVFDTNFGASLSGNSTAYSYYRTLGVSGSTNGSPWFIELEFQTAAVAGKEARLHGWAVNY